MNKNITKPLLIFAILSFVVLQLICLAPVAKADANNMLWGGYEGNVQNATGLGNQDPRSMVGSVLKVFLGFLGVISVIIVAYGGFMWMTAAGNEDRVDKAKKIITAGVVGLVIILMSFGIAQFVMANLYNATGATG